MRNVLAAQLKSGQLVLMDNLCVHKKSRWVRDLIEEKGCQLWLLPRLLPSYSPDFNPIRGSLLLQSEEPSEEGEGEDPPGALRSHSAGARRGQ